ncbi:MAG: phosphodiester glycosidase family protein [Gudongella sp.]|nr:phosphodiester glycosidase family protein [Gudongella sp.]
MIKKIISLMLMLIILNSFGIIYGYTSGYECKTIGKTAVKFVELDMNSGITTKILNANGQMISTESLENMAKGVGAIAAINGTHFEAYEGIPVPWGTIIREGKVIHISNGRSVTGITTEGRLIVDRLSFEFKGFVNGIHKSTPWRINHVSTEPEAITIFTEEYGTIVKLQVGAKAAIIVGGKVTEVVDSDFVLPTGAYAIVYNAGVVGMFQDRIKVGDEFRYEVIVSTTFTEVEEWDKVVNAIGAGPSLIINGKETADGLAEDFLEAKINTSPAERSFIGSKVDGKIVIGNMGAVTLKDAANIAKEMGLVNAMCLDGGGSIALYYPQSKISIGGRNINNGLAFMAYNGEVAKNTSSKLFFYSEEIQLEAYNIKGSNYFKLRDLAMLLGNSLNRFNVDWNSDMCSIELVKDIEYKVVGGELLQGDGKDKLSKISTAKVYMNGKEVELEAYNINGNNFYKLRDLGKVIGFDVDWNEETRSVEICTN